ncbi:MAG TPA: hypothetical protein VFT74_16870, partial [Isosphaeraceae bacterium]|nr:hypothetical protein [Isosphaeraceae bacterium]
MPTIVDIEKEIVAGLPNEMGDVDRRRVNNQYYEGDFRRDMEGWNFKTDLKRASRVMRRVIEVLTRHLYKDGPTRLMPGQEKAQAWLEQVYRANAVNALWQEADRLSLVNEIAAFQVLGATGPRSLLSPVEITIWGAEDLVVWLDPDDGRQPFAVATLDEFDQQRRLRLWTAEERSTWLTDKVRPGQTAGATAYKLSGRKANPYGVIPFAFAHANFPARYFWSGGPGSFLKDLNY